jgi:hypothetical protein
VGRRGTVENALMGCGALTLLAILAVVLLGLGVLLGRSDVEVDLPVEEPIEDILDVQDGNETAPRPPIGVVPENVTPGLVVRVSGPQGTVYSGAYGTTQGGMLPVDGVLGAVPAEYGVEAWSGAFDAVSAMFRKNQPIPGTLRVEVLWAGEVVAKGETSEELGSVEVNWNP